MSKPKILVFASGSAEGGGSGFEKLVEASRGGPLNAEIVAVVSNHENGGVRERADNLGIRFLHFPGPWTAAEYQKFANGTGTDFFALSGWLKKVTGLDPKTRFNSRTVFNIHPGPLPRFGGDGLYGHHVHEAVMAAFRRGEITHSAVSMHFVTEEYDRGPVFLDCKIKINEGDTPDSLARRVNDCEHYYQPRITDLVVNGLISWDGVNPDSLICPRDHEISFVDQE
jgi:phosphoribosylglycinamide formyltransferase-1